MPTWSGYAHVAFTIDLYPRAIVGWSASTCKDVAFVQACLNRLHGELGHLAPRSRSERPTL